MPTYCVVASLHTEWIVTNALDEQECKQQNGVLQYRANGASGCGASNAASYSYQSLADTGTQGITAALVITPLRLFRMTFSRSPFVAQLERMNAAVADEIEPIFASDPELAREVRNALFRASLLAASFLGPAELFSGMHYTRELHEGFANVAHKIAQRTKNDQARTAIEDTVKTVDRFVGKNFAEIRASLA